MPDNYWQDVEDIAREIIEQNGTNSNDWHDAIHENVDGSSWIIYNANHEEVLNQTNNEPEDDEVRGMSGDNASWRDMRQTAAFLAMQADVQQKLGEIVEEYKPDHFMLRNTEGIYLTWDELSTDEEAYEEAIFDDIDEAKEARDAYEESTDKQVEIIAFNENDKETPLYDV